MKTDSPGLLVYQPSVAPFWFQRLDSGLRNPPMIAMIEDDVTIAVMYRTQLERDGFEVRLATDGVSGLHLLQQTPPDLVLLDVRLPKKGGLDVLRVVAGDPRLAALPVLLLSNHSDPVTVSEGLRLGAKEYLVKSKTTPADLVMKIREHLPDR